MMIVSKSGRFPWAVSGILFCAAMNAAGESFAANPCEVVAHRGFSQVAPENTLASTSKAIEVGADWCECDVYHTADGAIVVMHDDKVDRTTNGHGKVVDLTLAEIKQLDAGSWKDRSYAKEPVPTLAEYLATLKDSHCKALIEIKMAGISDKVVAAVRDARMVDQAAVIAFNNKVVKEVRALEPRLPCGWLCGDSKKWQQLPPGQRADWIVTQASKCNASFVDLDYHMLSANLVAELQRRKVIVWAWTVDAPKTMNTLLRWGVTGITTNRPDVLCELLKR
jgi:glycerophosphoryl diester phosphodiesterase